MSSALNWLIVDALAFEEPAEVVGGHTARRQEGVPRCPHHRDIDAGVLVLLGWHAAAIASGPQQIRQPPSNKVGLLTRPL
jgi:hypothetical protein